MVRELQAGGRAEVMYHTALQTLRGASERVAAINLAVLYSNMVGDTPSRTNLHGMVMDIPPDIGYRPRVPITATCVTNLWARLALEVIGGGAARLGRSAAKTIRVWWSRKYSSGFTSIHGNTRAI